MTLLAAWQYDRGMNSAAANAAKYLTGEAGSARVKSR